jgi:hypothetical protein
MFEFVNEVIINSAKDSLSGLDKFNKISDEQSFRVLRVGDYKTANIKGRKIYKTSASNPQVSISKITITTAVIPTTGVINHIRLAIGMQLSGSADSYFAETMDDRRRRMFYANLDVVSTDTASNIASKLVEIINKQGNFYNNLRFKANLDPDLDPNSDSAKITVTSANEFQLFNVLEVQKLEDFSTAALGNYYPKEPVYRTILTGSHTQTAKEGVGTYWTMLKNVQIQTSLRTGIFNQDNDDSKIVPGASYNQYVFDYECERDHTGMGAVGEKLVSITKVVFWINTTISDNFETAVKNAGVVVDDIEVTSDNRAKKSITQTMTLHVGEKKYVDIKLSEYNTVTSNDTSKVTVKGTEITGKAVTGPVDVIYKKGSDIVLTVNVTVTA